MKNARVREEELFPYFIDDDVSVSPLYPCYALDLLEVILENKDYLSWWLPITGSLSSLPEAVLFLKDKFIDRKPYELYLGIWVNNALVGNLAIYDLNGKSEEIHISYWILPDHQGKGVATKGCTFLIDQAFAFKQIDRLVITCRHSNKLSHRMAERLGFLLKKTYLCEETSEFTSFYELSREAWLMKIKDLVVNTTSYG